MPNQVFKQNVGSVEAVSPFSSQNANPFTKLTVEQVSQPGWNIFQSGGQQVQKPVVTGGVTQSLEGQNQARVNQVQEAIGSTNQKETVAEKTVNHVNDASGPSV